MENLGERVIWPISNKQRGGCGSGRKGFLCSFQSNRSRVKPRPAGKWICFVLLRSLEFVELIGYMIGAEEEEMENGMET